MFRDLFDGKVPSKHENKLRLCFKELLKKSGDALKRNRQFIKKDQEAYQNQLEKSYHQCMDYLKPLIQPAGAPANVSQGVRKLFISVLSRKDTAQLLHSLPNSLILDLTLRDLGLGWAGLGSDLGLGTVN